MLGSDIFVERCTCGTKIGIKFAWKSGIRLRKAQYKEISRAKTKNLIRGDKWHQPPCT